MLDPQLLRTDPDAVAARLAARGYEFNADAWRDMDARRKELQVRTQDLQNRKNQSAKSIGEAKRRGEDIQPLLEEVKSLGEELGRVEAEFAVIRDEQQALMMGMPNLQLDDVRAGRDETDNVEVLKWGEPKVFDFEPRDHIELGELSGQLDAASAAVPKRDDGSVAWELAVDALITLEPEDDDPGAEPTLPELISGALVEGVAQLDVAKADAIRRDFSGMSGAAVADAAGLGIVEMEAMTESGYDRRFSAAITAAAGCRLRSCR